MGEFRLVSPGEGHTLRHTWYHGDSRMCGKLLCNKVKWDKLGLTISLACGGISSNFLSPSPKWSTSDSL